MGDNFHQGHKMWWIEWMANQYATGVFLAPLDETRRGQTRGGGRDYDPWSGISIKCLHELLLEFGAFRSILETSLS